MDYPYIVRRALTWPSGALKEGVSVSEYATWMRRAYNGALAVIYEGYELTSFSIYFLAKFHTEEEKIPCAHIPKDS